VTYENSCRLLTLQNLEAGGRMKVRLAKGRSGELLEMGWLLGEVGNGIERAWCGCPGSRFHWYTESIECSLCDLILLLSLS
jgi:hypothetical protein